MKSILAETLDQFQAGLRPFLKSVGFKTRGRTFNRLTQDGLAHVINIQMGSFGPPGTTHIPGLRENLYGLFTINLGVYVPEVARYHGGGEAASFVQDYHCCIRARLGQLGPEKKDVWWKIIPHEALLVEIRKRLERDGLPFLAMFGTRDSIVQEWSTGSTVGAFCPPAIVLAIILATRGQQEAARRLLAEQARNTSNPGHPAYVRALAAELGVGLLDDAAIGKQAGRRREE